MKRSHWLSLALLAAIVAIALVAVPRFAGSTERAAALVGPSLELDMDITNGAGPCNPIDTGRADNAGPTIYKIAVCLKNAPFEPAGFNFDLVFEPTLNECVVTPCTGTCLDANPDANAGSGSFSNPDLGTGWDCNVGGGAPPTCGVGRAFLQCLTTTGTRTLPIGEGVAAPIAEVAFKAIAGGIDNLTLENASVIRVGAQEFLNCDTGICIGGTDTKTGPTPQAATPTSTPTVQATPTCGLEGLPACTPTPRAYTQTPTPAATATATTQPEPTSPLPPPPPPSGGGPGAVISPPITGEGSDGFSWTGRLIWLVSGLGAISLIGGGLYLRRTRVRE